MAFRSKKQREDEEQQRRQAEEDRRERIRKHRLLEIQNEDPGVFATNSKAGFRLDLDLRVYFTPLMEDFGQGISFTRSLILPFPPSTKIAIGGSSIDGDNILPPMGFCPREILWDVDRQLFLAHTSCSHSGDPIAFIPSDLQSYLDNGWAIGSWQKHYDRQWKSAIGKDTELLSFDFDFDDESELEEMQTRPPNQRPKEFNKLFGAVIRMLIKLHNNEGNAYAMYKTKKYFPSDEYSKLPDAESFRQAVKEFNKMDFANQMKACKNVLRGAARFG